MKKILLKIVLGASLVFTSISCTKFIEINPIEQIPSELVLTNGKNVEAVLISSYSSVASGGFLGFSVPVYSELIGDNIALNEISFSATDFIGQIAFRNTNILNKDIDNLWQTAYRAIAAANTVIDVVNNNKITDGTPVATQQTWKAEALFIRAVAHFELTRFFSKPFSDGNGANLGVPLRVKYLVNDEKIPRSTVAEVYNQVTADLQAAIAGLPTTNGNRATSWAARGYLVRVLFDKRDYAGVVTAANLFQTSPFGFTGSPYASFRNTTNVPANDGVVFQLVNDGNPFGSFRPASIRYSIAQGIGSLKEALDVSGANDFRANANGVAETSGRFYSLKWDANLINVPVIRLAEIALSMAEAAAQTNDLTLASDAYNAVRGFNVTSYTPVTFTTQAAAIASIRAERRIELMFEGDRYHELRRLQTPLMSEVRNGTNIIRPAVPYNSNKLLLKIPVSETSGNNAIVQNPD